MSLWWRPAAGSKIKDRRWRSFILFYFVNTTGFVILPRIPQGRERVRGEPLPGFSPPAFNHPPAGDHFCTVKVPHQQKKTSKRMSLFCWCERWDLNPHDLTDTSTSSLPVCRFQHARERNLRYYNKIPPFVKRQPEKLPESFAVRPAAQAYKNSFFRGKEKTLEALRLQGFSCWCAMRDLNPHARNEH